MADKWNSVNELLPPEGQAVEVMVAQTYITLGVYTDGEWRNLNGQPHLSVVIAWRDGDREKLQAYMARCKA